MYGNISEFFNHLDNIVSFAKGRIVILHGDLNCRSPRLTNDKTHNNNGTNLTEWYFLQNNVFKLLNQKGVPTFTNRAGNKQSIIDYTFVTLNGSELVSNWHVNPTPSLSDHRLIRFQVSTNTAPTRQILSYDMKKANWERFDNMLNVSFPNEPHSIEQLDRIITNEMKLLEETSFNCIPQRAKPTNKNVWWNERLTQLKRNVSVCQKRLQRNNNASSEIREQLAKPYETSLNQYKKEIRKAKRRSYRKFCTEVDKSNFWSKVKALRSKTQPPVMLTKRSGQVCESQKEMCTELLDAFFPVVQNKHRIKSTIQTPSNSTPIIMQTKDLQKIIDDLPDKKAPGPDGINGKIFKRYFSLRKHNQQMY